MHTHADSLNSQKLKLQHIMPLQSQPFEESNKEIPQHFSLKMNNDQLTLWLRHHPDLQGLEYDHEIDKIKGMNGLY